MLLRRHMLLGKGGIGHTPDFYLATSSTDTSVTISIRFPVGKSITVFWGDGDSNTYNGNDDLPVSASHTYLDTSGYDIYMGGDYISITYLQCNSESLTGDVSGWSVLTNLTYLNCFGNSLTGDVSSWSALTNLITLRCDYNSLSGDISSWSSLVNLTYIRCNNNSFTGDISSWYTLVNLSGDLHCDNNNLDFDSTTSWASLTLTGCRFYFNNLTSTQVDNILIAFAGGPFVNTNIEIQYGSGVRTSASDAAVATLVANGCTVYTNGLTET